MSTEDDKTFISFEAPIMLKEELDTVVKAIGNTDRSKYLRAAIERQLRRDQKRLEKANRLPSSLPLAG